MNYFKFLYKRRQKRQLIRKLIDDYNDFHESVICTEMHKIDFMDFKNGYLESNFECGVCYLSYWNHDKSIADEKWIKRHAVPICINTICYSGYWCKPLYECNSYEELHENIQKRINILYIELNNPKI